jgi:hypothetical protein
LLSDNQSHIEQLSQRPFVLNTPLLVDELNEPQNLREWTYIYIYFFKTLIFPSLRKANGGKKKKNVC